MVTSVEAGGSYRNRRNGGERDRTSAFPHGSGNPCEVDCFRGLGPSGWRSTHWNALIAEEAREA